MNDELLSTYKEYLHYLSEFVAICSISADKSFQADIKTAYSWLEGLFTAHGFSVKKLHGPKSNPVLLASYEVNAQAETILFYGHYDVQPAQLSQGWLADPFKLRVEQDRLIARGVVDNKGQVLIHISTVFSLIESGELKYNVKFLIEGNEETGSPDIATLLEHNKLECVADYVIISDGQIANKNPVIESTLRGGFNIKLTLQTSNPDLHSGTFGGATPNASSILSNFLANLVMEDNDVSYPEFYNDVDDVDNDTVYQTELLSSLTKTQLENSGVKYLTLHTGENFYLRTCFVPTIQITGINSGYFGQGFLNSVPSKAEVRLNFRTVSSQRSEKVYSDFLEYVKKTMPKYVKYNVEVSGMHEPVKLNINSPMHKLVREYLEKAYGTKVLTSSVGGALPIVSDIRKALGKDAILAPFGNSDCNMHGPEENFNIDLVYKALKFSDMLLAKR
jgi:acetylornithine deacetylase/succinyl-diaminopimelate desuccinylase-like protein